MSSCEVGMYSREYAKGTLIGTKPFSLSWIDSPVTLLVLIEFEPKLVLTCRSTWGASTSSCCSKVLEIKTSVDWSSKTACVVNFLAGLDWWDACTRTILAHHLLVSSSPQTYVQAVDICFNSGVLDLSLLSGVFSICSVVKCLLRQMSQTGGVWSQLSALCLLGAIRLKQNSSS